MKESLPLLVGLFSVVLGAWFLVSNYKSSAGDVTADLSSACGRREGTTYTLCSEHKTQFFQEGLAILDGFLTDEELSTIESTYDRYMREGK